MRGDPNFADCARCGRRRQVTSGPGRRPASLCSSCTSTPLLELNRESWQADALCPQVGFDLFFVEIGGSTREAKRVCAMCPVRDQCLEYALANDERHGIWGGLAAHERQAILRRREVIAS